MLHSYQCHNKNKYIVISSTLQGFFSFISKNNCTNFTNLLFIFCALFPCITFLDLLLSFLYYIDTNSKSQKHSAVWIDSPAFWQTNDMSQRTNGHKSNVYIRFCVHGGPLNHDEVAIFRRKMSEFWMISSILRVRKHVKIDVWLICRTAHNMIPGSKGSNTIHACMIRHLILGPQLMIYYYRRNTITFWRNWYVDSW